MKLLMIGYWNSPEQLDEWIDPRGLVSAGNDSDLLSQYLSGGVFCDGEMGYSWCRFCCSVASERMGSGVLTDGVWAWPEGLSHYVSEHNILLPEAFRVHARKNSYKIPLNLSGLGLRSATKDFSCWEHWCSKIKKNQWYEPAIYDTEKVKAARSMSQIDGSSDPLGIL